MRGGESPACRYPPARAHLAQLVEHFHGKEGVDGSSPSVGFSVREVTINRLPLLKPRGVAPDTRCVRASGAGATNPQGGPDYAAEAPRAYSVGGERFYPD